MSQLYLNTAFERKDCLYIQRYMNDLYGKILVNFPKFNHQKMQQSNRTCESLQHEDSSKSKTVKNSIEKVLGNSITTFDLMNSPNERHVVLRNNVDYSQISFTQRIINQFGLIAPFSNEKISNSAEFGLLNKKHSTKKIPSIKIKQAKVPSFLKKKKAQGTRSESIQPLKFKIQQQILNIKTPSFLKKKSPLQTKYNSFKQQKEFVCNSQNNLSQGVSKKEQNKTNHVKAITQGKQKTNESTKIVEFDHKQKIWLPEYPLKRLQFMKHKVTKTIEILQESSARSEIDHQEREVLFSNNFFRSFV